MLQDRQLQSKVVLVRMAEMATATGDVVLRTIGLGSCVGVILMAPGTPAASLAHIMLPKPAQAVDEAARAKYATTAIPLMIESLRQLGVPQSQMQAKLVGGANMFRTVTPRVESLKIGERNVEMCRATLEQHGIPIVAEMVGGDKGRTVDHHCLTGQTKVKTVYGGEYWL